MSLPEYERAVGWIVRERAGSNGGWPPRDVARVSGWAVVRFTADLFDRSVREVARDIIDMSLADDLARRA
jgi:hypothetical protein